MKRIVVLLVAFVIAAVCLAGCGSSKCKECDREVYKDGYCEYHYAINIAEDVLNDAAGDLMDSIFG